MTKELAVDLKGRRLPMPWLLGTIASVATCLVSATLWISALERRVALAEARLSLAEQTLDGHQSQQRERDRESDMRLRNLERLVERAITLLEKKT